jgi:hypothetical protein
MWLLNTSTLQLRGFMSDSERPHYAILSHTWGVEEISFQEIQKSHDRIKHKAGYVKIQRCCAQAASDGFEYVWIDTCCIYREAVECYAYLVDVRSIWGTYDPGIQRDFRAFEKSRWFTRGWTLQELVAPSTVLFFNSDWAELGTRASLHNEISHCTGIPSAVLLSNNKGIE